jgi:hypothetical protein
MADGLRVWRQRSGARPVQPLRQCGQGAQQCRYRDPGPHSAKLLTHMPMSGSGRDLDAEMIPGVIGRLEKTVIDCPDPRALAEFYCQVLGMRINEDIGSWVVIGSGPGLT